MTRHTNDDERDTDQTKLRRPKHRRSLGRRMFLKTTSKIAVVSAVLGSLATKLTPIAQAQGQPPKTEAVGDESAASTQGGANQRLRRDTNQLRLQRARVNYDLPLAPLEGNGDEARYPNKIGTDTRGLPHDKRGEVDLAAYALYKRALETQDPSDFERIPLGGKRKLLNTLGSVALSLTGSAQSQIRVTPAPTLASAERAADAVELYWQALLRDVPFSEYRNDTKNELVLAAAAELTRLSSFTGPRDTNGRVTPSLLFRGSARYPDPSDPTKSRTVPLPGELDGPYISQFLLRDVPYGGKRGIRKKSYAKPVTFFL